MDEALRREMFYLCMPWQIERAYREYPDYPPDWVARLVLRGRFGFKKGIKDARKAPAPPKKSTSKRKKKGDVPDCPPQMTQEQAANLLEEVLSL